MRVGFLILIAVVIVITISSAVFGILTITDKTITPVNNVTVSNNFIATLVNASQSIKATVEINASDFYDDGTNLNNKYVDEAGDTLAGDLDLDTNDLINVGVANTTKLYVGNFKLELDSGDLKLGGE